MEVVHRDRHLLVLTKPPRLPTTHPKGGDCLVERAKAFDRDAPRLHATSRLDAEVTGLVTFARTRHANDALRAARREGRYGRLYLALAAPAEGPLTLAETWDEPIAIDPSDPRRRIALSNASSALPGGAKHARTRPRLRERTDRLALLELRPETGRTHQLRVHAAAHGLPLVGDVHYGGAKRVVLANGRVLTARRTMLHCAALRLPDVDAGGELHLALDPPEDFRELWLGTGGDPVLLEPGAA